MEFETVVIISANISEKDKAFLDKLVVDEVYDNRSQAIRVAIKLLRYSPSAIVYNNNQPHMTTSHKPRLFEFTQSYDVDPQVRMGLMNELKKDFKTRFKGREKELSIPEPEPIEEVDAGFDILEFDPDKCKEALMEGGCVVQCPNFSLDGEDYCQKHVKKKSLILV